MSTRFDMPVPGPPSAVRFPPVDRSTLDSGLAVWTIEASGAPLVAMLLVINRGAANDPADRHGLAGLTADVMDEGAGGRDAIALADAFMRLGTELDVEVSPDVTTFGLMSVSRVFPDVLALVGDVVARPRLAGVDFERIRELRLNRLRQLSRSPGVVADRAFLTAAFGAHPYGHGTMGTTASLEATSIDDVRAFWSRAIGPAGATLIVAGDIRHDASVSLATRVFGEWRPEAFVEGGAIAAVPGGLNGARVLLVDRPGAPQSELRVGHEGPPRQTPDYHAALTLNALLGGQFSSRINRSLRETRGVTYGARTSFDMRRAGGSFTCATSVQADATAASVAEILRQFAAVREPGSVQAAELELAKASLTRGYVRNFETAAQLARAASQMAIHGLPHDEFDIFVPRVDGIGAAEITAAARAHVRPGASAVVVVGDRAACEDPLAALGHPVEVIAPEF
jgi:zinc protease